MSRRPRVVPVHCPNCQAPGEAAVLHFVPRALKYTLVPESAVDPATAVHSCDKCPKCGTTWCVIDDRRQQRRTA